MATATQTPTPQKRVLVVEDEAIIAADIRSILQELGYNVPAIANSGEEALTLAEKEKADLVLMDIQIRGKSDGIQTAEKLWKLCRVPVVYVTGHTDDETLERARATVPLGYITKPVTFGAIKAAVAVALEQQENQRQLEKREEFLQLALRTTAEALIIADIEGRISFFNAAAQSLTGIPRTAAIGQPIEVILQITAHGNQYPAGAWWKPVSGFTIGSLHRPDSSICPVLLCDAEIKGSTGNAPGTIVVIRDISPLLERDQHVRDRLNTLSDALAVSGSFDAQTIPSLDEQLALSHPDWFPEGPSQYWREIGEECERVSARVFSSMEYAIALILDRGSDELIDSAVSYRQAVSNLQHSIDSSHATMSAAEFPLVFAHHTGLTLIFQNLLRNAIQHSGRDFVRISISAVQHGSTWQFTVADNGEGFPAEQSERIFSGGGVGLAICKRLVEQYGGKIWAQSIPGQGARFHFTLRGSDVVTTSLID